MIFTKLILAHLLGDFIFQPTSWVRDKEKNREKSLYLYLHVFVHFLLAMLLLWNLKLWWIAAIIAATHYVIDWAKLKFQKKNTQRSWFIWDQILHFTVIVIISFGFSFNEWRYYNFEFILPYLTGFLFLTVPSSIIIKNLISYWVPDPSDKDAIQTESLVNAGKYIGILERLLVFAFITVDHWEGVGFMIAAKSVFRFSDLAQARQRKLTEYVLIGTLLSFGIAILTGMIIELSYTNQ